MTPEAQRIGIAEACGYTHVEASGFRTRQFVGTDSNGDRSYIPDYLNDLNAMHEAEKVLTYERLPFYIATLKNPVLMKEQGVSDFDIVHATAAQRAEAFLRTLGRWKE